jgi:hypothetical protein
MQRFLALVSVAAVGCTWVSDAQYDDRATELEAFRSEFLPASDKVQLITAAENRFFWVSLEKPLDEPMLHSYDPATDQRVAYEFSRADTNIEERYQMSGALVVKCTFSTTSAFDATQSNRLIAMTTMGSDLCAVDAGDVYFRVGRTIKRWTPGQGDPVVKVDLDLAKVGTGSVNGFAVLGRQLLLAEGGRLWLIDTGTGTATWLENKDATSGAVVFDERGVVFDTSPGITHITFADHASFLLDDAIGNGGYELNGGHDDIHFAADSAEYTLHAGHVIYRGIRGIFAYGFDSKKVVDLLLDRGTGFDAHPRYRFPSVTADGTLFVHDNNSTSASDRPVYRVSLTGRLR